MRFEEDSAPISIRKQNLRSPSSLCCGHTDQHRPATAAHADERHAGLLQELLSRLRPIAQGPNTDISVMDLIVVSQAPLSV